jgi:acyl-CoA synthetase (AMP-forming)/AMP-acid ligase II
MTTTAPTRRPARWTSLVGAGIRVRLLRRINQLSNLDYWTKNAATIQRAQLRRLLSLAKSTEFGKKHDFARLAALDDKEIVPAYRKTVPVGDWYAFKDLISRMRESAEPDILWPGLVRDFAQTSGTTAGDKFIPVSKAMLRSNFLASLDIFANLARFGIPLSRITAGRCLFLGGSSDCPTSDKGIRTGDLSGLVTPLIRWPISKIYSPGPEIALMSNWPSKIEAMAKACLDQDIRMISGMPSWAIVLFERVIAEARSRGREVSTIRQVWPNLQVFVHGGVKYAPFDPRVRQFWSGSPKGDDVPNRLELYPASEGFVAIQDAKGDPGLRLNTDIGLFFEFIPLENASDPDPPAFACDEVEKGQKYVVTLTTCAGLWRYILGDVVEFDSIPNSLTGKSAKSSFGPPRLRIVGRHKHFINAFGENLIVEHIENAVAAASRQTGLLVGEFTAAPRYPQPGQRGAVELAIEVEGTPGEAQVTRFRDAFDAALKTQSVDYGVKRTNDLGMAPPTVSPLAMGAFHRWMQSRGKLGGQHKCPRCANGREIIDAVILFAKA